MKKIDAHLHFHAVQSFDELALAAGHENTEEHLRHVIQEEEIVCGIAMGNYALAEPEHPYPDFLRDCIRMTADEIQQLGTEEALRCTEHHLRRPGCVGIKLYPGYQHTLVSDPIFFPFYDLTRSYQKVVAIHTGATAGTRSRLRYSHPFTLDDAAAQFPDLQFVMCHFGNPWLTDAAAVLEKNNNIAADLSGLWEGLPDLETLFTEKEGYLQFLKTWIGYVGDFDRFLYGTDWPLVNIPFYEAFLSRIIPEAHWESVFFKNANRIYRLGLE